MSDDIGPDPHLNERGVRLSRHQRRVLGVTAALIGLGLVLALVGLRTGFPSGSGALQAAPVRIVLDGPARAQVIVQQDGAVGQRAEVALPYDVPVDGGASVVAVEARALGAGGTAITCTVLRTADAHVEQSRTAGASGDVRCGAVLR